jgi:hypothetical protein
MSARPSPPPASINIAWHNTLAVMEREPLAGGRDVRRQAITEPGERSKSVQADMSDDLLAAPFHHHRRRAVSVHLASALPARVLTSSTATASLVWWAPPQMGQDQLTRPGE